jgi:hypothetical protein
VTTYYVTECPAALAHMSQQIKQAIQEEVELMNRTDTRPDWPDHWEVTEEQARFIDRGVTVIRHGWKFTGPDTSEDWLDLITEDGSSMRADRLPKEVFFQPDHRCLLSLQSEVKSKLMQIDHFERANVIAREVYERLKARFG